MMAGAGKPAPLLMPGLNVTGPFSPFPQVKLHCMQEG